MKPKSLLRIFWREVLIALLLGLPLISLIPLGIIWLWQNGGTLLWVGAILACMLLAWLLTRSKRSSPPQLSTPSPGGDPSWGPAEVKAWEKIQRLAEDTPAISFTDQDEVLALCQQTLQIAAGDLHPDTVYHLGRFTIPEALLALESVSRSWRADLLERVPLIRQIRVSDAYSLLEQKRKHWPLVEKAMLIYRIGRFFTPAGPLAAVGNEASSALWEQMKERGLKSITAGLTQTLILEIGRAAINLYGGRFYLSAGELKARLESEKAEVTAAPAPIRILLAGQVDAGKSSLINALAGETRAPVSVLPTPAGFQLFEVAAPGQPGITIVDSPGLTLGQPLDALIEEAKQCDLLVWVAAANQPARAVDSAALERLRAEFAARLHHRTPPVLLAVTHIDQLKPAREWEPPYDISTPTTAKAQNIRLALEAVAAGTGIELAEVIPVAMPAGNPSYNVELLWARIAGLLPEAQQIQLNRLMTDARGRWDARQILTQAAQGGRAVLKTLLENRKEVTALTLEVAQTLLKHIPSGKKPRS